MHGHLQKWVAVTHEGTSSNLDQRLPGLERKPFFVISGSFTTVVTRSLLEREELLKIKAGGVNTVEPTFLDLSTRKSKASTIGGTRRACADLSSCAPNTDLKVLLRIGPFCHGEWRNGGLPDCSTGQPFEVTPRTNPGLYGLPVERYYAEIGKQCE